MWELGVGANCQPRQQLPVGHDKGLLRTLPGLQIDYFHFGLFFGRAGCMNCKAARVVLVCLSMAVLYITQAMAAWPSEPLRWRLHIEILPPSFCPFPLSMLPLVLPRFQGSLECPFYSRNLGKVILFGENWIFGLAAPREGTCRR